MRIEEEGTSRLVLWAVAAWGAIAAILSTPLTAALMGLIWRFPIPFDGTAGGLAEAGNAGLASIYYLVMGEGFLLAALGATAGYFIARALTPYLLRPLILAILASAVLSLLSALVLAIFA
ncbi:hypothetical protein ACIP5Y_38410 [Nocardia sp. NPDC088792]|uniref:hypothetical protein n=1 Tax=Nocardia sp. NPDC088792 TaxID=3364332 RepID=UPI00380F54CF